MINYTLFLIFFNISLLYAKISSEEYGEIRAFDLSSVGKGYLYPVPPECSEILNAFAQSSASFTLCSIQYARPIRLCSKCVDQYIGFDKKFKELDTVINGTSCRTIFISQDRLDAVLEYYDNILDVWEKANCNACYDWSGSSPVLSNDTKHFYKMYNDTMYCITSNFNPAKNNSEEVCEKCMQPYIHLDVFYNSLTIDDSCMDVLDSMNATRSIWSKSLNCCKLRRTPEIVFLCCTAIISLLPVLYYLAVRFCGPIRDLPNVLKQSRFKQTIMRSVDRSIN